MHQAVKITKIGLTISEGCKVKLKICNHLFAHNFKSKNKINIRKKIKNININKQILLIFLLFG